MNFRKVKQILNRKLIEIWSYRKYTSAEEKKAEDISKKKILFKKLKVKLYLPGDANLPGNI